MSIVESSVLVLRTSDLSKLGTNISGSRDANNVGPFTWSNIDLKSVMGPMYDKYDLFNLQLSMISSGGMDIYSNIFGLSSDPNNNTLMLQMSGLPFINNLYNASIQHSSQNTTIGCFGFNSYSTVAGSTTSYFPLPGYTQYSTSQTNTFGKNQPTVNITINYRRILDNQAITTGTIVTPTSLIYPEVQFVFSITGIPKVEGNLNLTRMKLTHEK